jgi:hypothetical protein
VGIVLALTLEAEDAGVSGRSALITRGLQCVNISTSSKQIP